MRILRFFLSNSAVSLVIALAALASAPFGAVAQAHHPKGLLIGGTGTALGGMQLVANEFKKSHPNVKVTILPSLGSGGGIRALLAHKIGIAVSARPLKAKEQSKRIVATEYARTPLVFATRRDTATVDVTTEQLAPIYRSNGDWPDGSRLRLVMRPLSESDNKLLGSMSKDLEAAIQHAVSREGQFIAMTDQENASALERIPGSFGMTTLAQIISERRHVKPLSFNGVSGTVEALNNKRYPYAKRLFYVSSSAPRRTAKAFLSFLNSDAGRAVLKSSGHLVVRATK